MNRLTIEQEREALRNAVRKAGMEDRIEYMERKSDAHTYAEKLMLNAYRKGMPYKASYLYCDTVDACFFFDHAGKACVTLSAQWWSGSKDLGKQISEAIRYIESMLGAMDAEANKWLGENRDERH